MSDRSLHNEGREPVMRDVQQVLKSLREGNTENPEVLGIEAYEVMQALNKGFPKHMYHATLDPVMAMDKQDQRGLEELGYTPHYIPRDFPCWIHRRNFSPKYALRVSDAGQILNPEQVEFVESRIVRDAKHYAQIMKEPKPPMPQGIEAPGAWVKNIADIPEIVAESPEEKMQQMARLEGQLEEARRQLQAKGNKAN